MRTPFQCSHWSFLQIQPCLSYHKKTVKYFDNGTHERLHCFLQSSGWKVKQSKFWIYLDNLLISLVRKSAVVRICFSPDLFSVSSYISGASWLNNKIKLTWAKKAKRHWKWGSMTPCVVCCSKEKQPKRKKISSRKRLQLLLSRSCCFGNASKHSVVLLSKHSYTFSQRWNQTYRSFSFSKESQIFCLQVGVIDVIDVSSADKRIVFFVPLTSCVSSFRVTFASVKHILLEWTRNRVSVNFIEGRLVSWSSAQTFTVILIEILLIVFNCLLVRSVACQMNS